MSQTLKAIGQLQEKYPRRVGYVYCVVGSVGFSFMQIVFKQTTKFLSTSHALYIRALWLFGINAYFLSLVGHSPYVRSLRNLFFLCLRILISITSVSLFFIPIQYLPLGVANSIKTTGPLFTHFLQAAIFNTPIHKKDFLITLLSFSGIILILKPQFLFGEQSHHDAPSAVYCSMVLLSTLFSSSSLIIIRLLRKEVPANVNMHYFYLGQTAFNGLNMLLFDFEPQPPIFNGHIILLLSLLVICAYTGQTMISRAVTLLPVAKVTPFSYIEVIIGSVADMVLYHIKFDVVSVFGMIITTSGLIYSAVNTQPPQK